MTEQLTPADAALLSRVLGHEIEPGLVRTLGPSTLAAIIQAARSEGPHTGESGDAGKVIAGLCDNCSSYSMDLHRNADDEWICGPCRTEEAFVPAPPPPKGEALPVAWQVRTKGKTAWSSWWHSDEKPDPTDFNGGYGVEIRPLYARPSPGVSLPVVITDEMVEAALREWNGDATHAWSDVSKRYMRAALEAALLSRGEG